jgi:hypothetical protein
MLGLISLIKSGCFEIRFGFSHYIEPGDVVKKHFIDISLQTLIVLIKKLW